MILDLENVRWWVQFILGIVALISTIGVPVWRTLIKYNKELKTMSCDISNNKQTIKELEKNSKTIETDLGLIKSALLATIKVELDKQCSKALNNNFLTIYQLESIELLFSSYKSFGGNSGLSRKVERVRGLEIKQEK